MKKVFAQTIISMAHHGYLELESGEDMIEFIVRQCTLNDEVCCLYHSRMIPISLVVIFINFVGSLFHKDHFHIIEFIVLYVVAKKRVVC